MGCDHDFGYSQPRDPEKAVHREYIKGEEENSG